MDKKNIARTAVLIKRGRIENTGNRQVFSHSTVFNGVTFDDGEAIRQIVQVESSIASWVAPEVEGTFVFTRGPKNVLMLAAVEGANGLRVANPGFATHLKAEAMGHIVWYTLAAVVCIGVFGLIGPLAIIALPALLSFVVLVIKASGRIGPHSGFSRVVKSLDRSRELPRDVDSSARAALI